MSEEKRTVGNLIRSIRENRKISREKLSLGLCSATTLMRYELGERIPDKFMADALLERMGQIPFQYEFIGSEQEFQFRMMRNQIEKLQKKDREKALFLIREYESFVTENDSLHMQYLWMKKAEIFCGQENFQRAEQFYRKALGYTELPVSGDKLKTMCRIKQNRRCFYIQESSSIWIKITGIMGRDKNTIRRFYTGWHKKKYRILIQEKPTDILQKPENC